MRYEISSRPELTINFSRVELRILSNCNGAKIETKNDFRLLIGKVIVITGITQAPADEVVNTCWNIMDHFSSFTAANFLEAFEFNEALVYDKRVEHFNSFLPAYMSEVLHKYRNLKNRAEIEWKKALLAATPKPRVETGEECFKSLEKHYLENKELPRFWDWSKVFIYLEEAGEIKLSIEEKKKIAASIQAKINTQKSQARDLAEMRDIEALLNGENLVKEARKQCVFTFFGL